jgi:hypothetical protein
MAINPTGRSGSMQLNTNSTTVRQSPRSDFGTQVRNGIGAGAGVVAGATSVAAPFVPGGAVVSAAVNGAASGMQGGGYSSQGAGNAGFATAGDLPIAGGPGLNTPGGAPKTGNMQQDLINQTKGMQEMMASFNLQYLQLQQKMQSENRSFTTVTNVMKTKHDTSKASINNIR